MKLAFLILAHKNPKQLVRLVNVLTAEGDSVFIHIDKKASSFYEEVFPLLSEKQSVHLLQHRLPVHWGSYNQIKATVDLLKKANEQKDVDYFFLISGQDLPLKPVSEIKFFLKENNGKEFLHHSALPDMEKWSGDNGGLNRLQFFWMNGKLGRYSGYIHILQKKTGMLRSVKGLALFGGANWFTLSQKSVSWMVAYLEKNPDYLKRFKFTRCADEIFTQTLLMNSPFALNVVNDSLRYINWYDGPEFPKTLRKEDFEKMFSDGSRLFARKFDEQTDEEVIEMVYRKIEQ